MKKLMLFVAVVGVVSLASCKKKTCTYTDGAGNTYTSCTSCTTAQVNAYKLAGETCK
jgi:hypothetical protein